MRALAVSAVILLLPSWALASGIRCKDRVVSTGSSMLEVEARCGKPVHVDVQDESRIVRHYRPGYGYVEQRLRLEVERWTYVLGPHRLIRTAIFQNGRLHKVHTEGRPPQSEGSINTCRRSIHSTGDTTGEVLLRCGPPDSEYRWEEEVLLGDGYVERRVLIPHERWIYNFGPKRFLRILTFRRGRLVEQRSGSYGW